MIYIKVDGCWYTSTAEDVESMSIYCYGKCDIIYEPDAEIIHTMVSFNSASFEWIKAKKLTREQVKMEIFVYGYIPEWSESIYIEENPGGWE